jgi:hypothetical protein
MHQEGYSILLGGNGESLSLLQQEFPQFESVTLPGMRIRYGHGKQLWFQSLLHFPSFLLQIIGEHRAVQKICMIYQPQIIISDNRYGVWSHGAKNILLTHQLHPFMPKGLGWTRNIAAAFIRFLSSSFQEIWIPDIPVKQNLSGELSDWPTRNLSVIRHLGILSRLKDVTIQDIVHARPDIFVILSGPEPQRSIFEKLIYEKFGTGPFNVYVLRGKPGITNTEAGWKVVEGFEQTGKLFFINHLPASELAWYLQHSQLIIARPGYSTIMDLVQVMRSALLIPTPGQPEQEYLGRRMDHLGIFAVASQDEFPLLEIQIPGYGNGRLDSPVIMMNEEIEVSIEKKEQELRLLSSAFRETTSSL